MTNNTLILQICRHTIAFVWLYQGLVPKLLGPHQDEMAMNRSVGIDEATATFVAYTGGGLEMILGVLVFLYYKSAWPFLMTAMAMIGLLAFTAIYTPLFMVAAFNPTTINVSLVALSAIALVCLRQPHVH